MAMSLNDLGIVLRLTGRAAMAVIEQRHAQGIRMELNDVPPQETATAHVQYALSESDVGDYEDARSNIQAGIAELTGIKGLDSDQLANAILADARIELAGHNVTVGCALARQAIAMRPADDPTTGWRHAEAQGVYGSCLAGLGQLEFGTVPTARSIRLARARSRREPLDDTQRMECLAGRFPKASRISTD